MEREQRRALAVSLGALVVMMWAAMPPWQRHHLIAVVKAKVRRCLALSARRTGHAAMGSELAGRDAEPGYRLAYELSKMRDAL